MVDFFFTVNTFSKKFPFSGQFFLENFRRNISRHSRAKALGAKFKNFARIPIQVKK